MVGCTDHFSISNSEAEQAEEMLISKEPEAHSSTGNGPQPPVWNYEASPSSCVLCQPPEQQKPFPEAPGQLITPGIHLLRVASCWKEAVTFTSVCVCSIGG